eukprot:7051047-Pyramimonas_sp.AAC.1
MGKNNKKRKEQPKNETDVDAAPSQVTPNKKKKVVTSAVRSSEADEVGPSGREGDIAGAKTFRNKEKVLILASRGITHRHVSMAIVATSWHVLRGA